MDDARIASLEADFVDAQTRLVRALIALQLAQDTHARLFGPTAYRESLEQIGMALKPRPLEEV